MRQVLYKEWIPAIRIDNSHIKPGTNCWSDFIAFGWFHGWGLQRDEYVDGKPVETKAIIEKMDGTIEFLDAWQIKFIDTPEILCAEHDKGVNATTIGKTFEQ